MHVNSLGAQQHFVLFSWKGELDLGIYLKTAAMWPG